MEILFVIDFDIFGKVWSGVFECKWYLSVIGDENWEDIMYVNSVLSDIQAYS